ncbi:MAG: NAD(P)-dependent oxidoreductase [Proteobacteria bacterium]|nr:NAD(P)-dependent oxidoreductase [Pseudomonadota bacterium]
MSDAPQLLIVAAESAPWTDAVMALASPHRRALVVAPDAEIETSAVEVVVGAPPDLAAIIPRCPQLRWVQSTWAGIDAIAHFASETLKITPLKGVFGPAMTEYVMGWLLAIERNVMSRASHTQWTPTLEPRITGKRMGIMGTGGIGTAIALAARAFGLEVIGLNSDGRAVEGFTACYPGADRLAFAEGLDYLVSVLPQTSQTDNLIDEGLLMRLSPRAIVINAGRGNALLEADLIASLNAGHVRAAVLDVFREEPLPPDDPLWSTSGVYVTSHTAGPTPDEAFAEVFERNLKRYIAGEPLTDPVRARRGY